MLISLQFSNSIQLAFILVVGVHAVNWYRATTPLILNLNRADVCTGVGSSATTLQRSKLRVRPECTSCCLLPSLGSYTSCTSLERPELIKVGRTQWLFYALRDCSWYLWHRWFGFCCFLVWCLRQWSTPERTVFLDIGNLLLLATLLLAALLLLLLLLIKLKTFEMREFTAGRPVSVEV